MIKIFLTLLTLITLGGGTLNAQVAVPNLAPGAPQLGNAFLFDISTYSFAPDNPAAMQWGSPSRAGGGWIEGSSNVSDPAIGKSDVVRGQYTGLRWVGEDISIAGEKSLLDVTFPTNSIKEDHHSFAFAFETNNNLAIGISSTSGRKDFDLLGTNSSLKVTNRTLGFSWKTGENLFLGAAYGKDYAEISTAGVATVEAKRPYAMYGMGLRGGGGMIWHMEVTQIVKHSYLDTVGNHVAEGYGYKLSQGTLTFGFWNMIFGGSVYQLKADQATGPTVKGTVLDGGWAPPIGLTITGRWESNKMTNSTFANEERIISTIVTYQF